jgi:large subunit ribosomal protein L18
MITKDRRATRDRRHLRLRRHLRGTATRPRLAVFRSLKHIAAQLIDDETGRTLAAADSRSATFRQANGGKGGNIPAAKAVGELIARTAKERGIERVVFDRGGYQYHGRVKALADAARAGGLVF